VARIKELAVKGVKEQFRRKRKGGTRLRNADTREANIVYPGRRQQRNHGGTWFVHPDVCESWFRCRDGKVQKVGQEGGERVHAAVAAEGYYIFFRGWAAGVGSWR